MNIELKKHYKHEVSCYTNLKLKQPVKSYELKICRAQGVAMDKEMVRVSSLYLSYSSTKLQVFKSVYLDCVEDPFSQLNPVTYRSDETT